MNCISCGRAMEDGAEVCPHCGVRQDLDGGTKVCVSCGSIIAEKAIYCRICGTSQEVMPVTEIGFSDARKCPSCGEPFGPETKYCGNCGAKLPEIGGVPAEARRKLREARGLRTSILLGTGLLVLLALIITLIVLLSGGGEEHADFEEIRGAYVSAVTEGGNE